LASAIVRNSLLLALVAGIGVALIVATQLATHDRIVAGQRAAEQRPLLDLLPSPHHDLALTETAAIADAELLGLRKPRRAFIAHRHSVPVAVILPVTAREGYNGDIQLWVGIDTGGKVTGVRVLSHRETPGLGDRIATDNGAWLRQFQQRSLQSPSPAQWAITSDQGEFDQLTGATITSRATTKAIRQALEYFAAHRDALLSSPSTLDGEARHGR
jgi:electron transport complex protein RnfG